MKDDRILLVLEMRTEQREWKKLTMVKAQAYLKVGKTKKSEVLDDFCEEEGYCRRHAARVLHQAASCIILIPYDGGSTRTTTRKEILLRVVWVRGMGRSCVH